MKTTMVNATAIKTSVFVVKQLIYDQTIEMHSLFNNDLINYYNAPVYVATGKFSVTN